MTLAFGGDVHFEGPLAVRLADDPATALDGGLSRLIAGADLSMMNFESALISGRCTDPQPKQYVFHAPAAAITAFRAAGVTLVTEANNHGEDCGRPGLAQSLQSAALPDRRDRRERRAGFRAVPNCHQRPAHRGHRCH